MPPVKLTAATAVSGTQQVITEIRKGLRDAGPAPWAASLLRDLDSLELYCTSGPLLVEVLWPPLAAEQRSAVTSLLGIEGDLAADERQFVLLMDDGQPLATALLRPLSKFVPRPLGRPAPPIVVLLALEENAATLPHWERAAEERPHALVVTPAAAEAWKRRLTASCDRLAWSSSAAAFEELGTGGLEQRLAALQAHGEVLRAAATAAALEALTRAWGIAIDQQLRDLRGRKALVAQKLNKSQARPASTDALAEIKPRLLRLAAEFEQGVAERLQDLVAQPVGQLSRETERRLASLATLDHENRTTTVATKIPTAFEQQLNSALREQIWSHCAADITALNDFLGVLEQETTRLMMRSGAPAVVLKPNFMTEGRLRRMLELTAPPQSAYRGEMPRPGFGEFFSSVRKYSMMLVMAASMFGASSLMRKFREYTLPLTIMLVLFGTFNAAISTRRLRVENLTRELEAARQSFRPEVRRYFAEILKQWLGIVSQHLADQVAALLASCEAAIKDQAARKPAERDSPQKQAQSLDLLEKKLAVAQKGREIVSSTVTQAVSELRTIVKSSFAPAPAKR